MSEEPWLHPQEREYRRYTLWFVYACIIYSLIGFSWGALMGGFIFSAAQIQWAINGAQE